jgi:hypothetical protein
VCTDRVLNLELETDQLNQPLHNHPKPCKLAFAFAVHAANVNGQPDAWYAVAQHHTMQPPCPAAASHIGTPEHTSSTHNIHISNAIFIPYHTIPHQN